MGGSEGGGGGEMTKNMVVKKINLESHNRVFKILDYYTAYFSIPNRFSINYLIFVVLIFFYEWYITSHLITCKRYLLDKLFVRGHDSKHTTESNKYNFCDSHFNHCISYRYREKSNAVDVRGSTNRLSELAVFRIIICQERFVMCPYKIEITATPDRTFEIPVSDGYQLYSAILNQIKKSDPQVSALIHNSNRGSLRVSSLDGIFKNLDQEGYKILENKYIYKFNIGIIFQEESRVYQAIARTFVFDEGRIDLLNGSLIVMELKDYNESFDEIAKSCVKYDRPLIEFDFKTTTCIQYQNSRVTEMFPHRGAVYLSLLSKWNHACPDDLKLTITYDEISRYVIEKPVPESYCTHSVMVSTVHDEKNNTIKPIFKQGFGGKCVYAFTKDAPRNVQDIILTLSKFAEYSGVGSGVSRGCGCVEVKMREG